MSFYDASDAKAYAKNKTRIIKEISDIENTIAEAVDNGEYLCEVHNTIMTNESANVVPTIEAEAHCVMQLTSVHMKEDGTPNFFRVGEKLSLVGDNSDSKLLLRIKEVDNNGNIVDVDILERGNYTKLPKHYILDYDNKKDWLDVNSNFGQYTDIMIDRNNNVYVKDYINMNPETEGECTWYPIEKTYTLHNCIDDKYGSFGDIFTVSDRHIFIKNKTKWNHIGEYFDYRTFKMPMIFGKTFQVVKNVFGKTYVKNTLGWVISPRIKELNHRPRAHEGYIYDICHWTEDEPIYAHCPHPGHFHYYDKYNCHCHCHHVGTDCTPEVEPLKKYATYTDEMIKEPLMEVNGEFVPYVAPDCSHLHHHHHHHHKKIIGWRHYEGYAFKCEKDKWVAIEDESKWLDWEEKPTDNFARDNDIFFYNDKEYRIKVDGKWMLPNNKYRFDLLFLSNDYGKDRDIIKYSGCLEPYHTYVKVDGVWKQVQKVWNLHTLKLGKVTQPFYLTFGIKNIVMDNIGDGYNYDTNVIFSDGEASAIAEITNGKIINTKVVYGGESYIDVPEVNYVMTNYLISEKYYQVWKEEVENYALQDEMEQVIKYFEKNGYTISRVSNDNGKTFHWVVMWS